MANRSIEFAVAKAAKAAGIEAPVDTRLDGDRAALIDQLRYEREHGVQHAEAGVGTGAPAGAGTGLMSDVDALFGKRG